LSCSQFVQICMIQEQHHKEVTVLWIILNSKIT
jgi:hypothetical protein